MTVSNTGNAVLTLGTLGFTGTYSSDFTLAGTCQPGGTIQPAASCDAVFYIKPTGANSGVQTADLNITSNGGNKTINVIYESKPGPAIQITGSAASNTAVTAVSFGTGDFQTPTADPKNANLAPQSIYVKNIGSAPMMVNRIYLSGTGEFVLPPNTCIGAPIATGGNCKVDISAFPGSAGSKSGTLFVETDAFNGTPRTVALTATVTGTPPAPVAVTPNPSLTITAIDMAGVDQLGVLNFSKTSPTTVGQFSARYFIRLVNAGGAPITLYAARVFGALADWFFVGGAGGPDAACGASIAAGATCDIGVDFKPVDARVGGANVDIEIWTDSNTVVNRTPASGSGI